VPLFTMFMAGLMWCICQLAWLGVGSKSSLVAHMYRFAMSYTHGLIFSVAVIHLMQLRPYLPSGYIEWRKSVVDPYWWLWFVTRLFGITTFDTRTIVPVMLWLGAVVWFALPFTHFATRPAACRLDAATTAVLHNVGDSGSNSYNSNAILDQSFVDVFLLNMMGHVCLTIMFSHIVFLLAMQPCKTPTEHGVSGIKAR
jgi:hypothetical protein